MKEISRIQFKYEQKPFVEHWNRLFEHQIQYGLIHLYKNSEEYEQLAQQFKTFYRDTNFNWRELIEVEYEEDDLSSCEILQLWISENVGEDGKRLGKIYDESDVCPRCNIVGWIRQRENIVLNLEGMSTQITNFTDLTSALYRTNYNNEIIVSLKAFLHNISQKHRTVAG